MRVPKIQEFIQEALNGTKPNQKLNNDEAATFGSGFLAASSSLSFKVKPMNIALQAPFDYFIKIKRLNNTLLSEAVVVKRREEYNKAGFQLNFTVAEDIIVELSEDFEGSKRVFETIKVISANATNVTLEFILNKFGIIDLIRAISTVTTKVLRNHTLNNETGTVELIEDVNTKHYILNLERNFPQRMNSSDFIESIQRLDELDKQEANIKVRSQAKNNFESIIYTGRDWLKDEANQQYIVQEVKQALLEVLDAVCYLMIKKK